MKTVERVGGFVVSHPTGNANVRNVLSALQEAGMLDEFCTTIAVFPNGFLDLLSKLPGLHELRRRAYADFLRRRTSTQPSMELLRLLAQRLGLGCLTTSQGAPLSIDNVSLSLDKRVAAKVHRHSPAAVYCYEDIALQTFKEAKSRGASCVYELPIGYWRSARRLLGEEAERRPEWRSTLGGLRDSPEKLARKDEELRLADRILVASSFTRQTLQECPFPIAPVSVVPYGANEDVGRREASSCVLDRRGCPLRVLFVGGLSQRKGVADLFEAVELLGVHAELTVIGRKPAESCEPLDSALRKHRWIESLPRERILEEMRGHDVLVFPSLFEGFGLVVTEALSQGMPVITTPHTCGPDVLTEEEDGFIVPIRDPQAITEKLELLHRDRERLAAMSGAASKKAKTLTWERYRQGVVEAVRETLVLKSA